MLLLEESKNNYDFILLTRFDVAFMRDFDLSYFDPDKFYAEGPEGPKVYGVKAIHDIWFFSNQKNMIAFSKLFDSLHQHQ